MRILASALTAITALASLQAGAPYGEDVKRQAPAEDRQATRPPGPEPKDPPPAPPAELPKPPSEPPRAERRADSPGGQWVYTEQYGWVWMPYGDRYTHVPPDGSSPSMYVYYPEAGWCWVVAPWLWGWGPRPYFGLIGPRFYGWWGVGFGHWYGFRGGYGRGWAGPHVWRGGQWHAGGGFRGFGGGVRR
jgi:hypothetical protein